MLRAAYVPLAKEAHDSGTLMRANAQKETGGGERTRVGALGQLERRFMGTPIQVCCAAVR